MIWNQLTSKEQVNVIKQRSAEVPCLILKHSTTCSISRMALGRLEKGWNFSTEELEPYYLDLLSYRPVSAFIAETFEVHHESPQALLIVNGECVFDTSHLDITIAELHEGLLCS